MSTKTGKFAVFLSPFAIFFCFMVLKSTDKKLYRWLTKEDHIIEYLTCVNYFLTFITTLLVARTLWQFRKRLASMMFYGFALVMLVFTGEEISWGQRIFNIQSSPFFLENSLQGEINLHNLKQISNIDYYLPAKVFALIGLIGFIASFSVQVLNKILPSQSSKLENRIFAPDWYLSGYFLLVFLYFFYLAYPLQWGYRFLNVGFRDQELTEFILSLTVLLFAFDTRLKIRNLTDH